MSQKLNVLVAYPYLTPRIIERLRQVGPDLRLLVDSGAFTAWKAGKSIALDDYCRFLETLPITPWRYFTLDVVGDPHASMVNYETMLRRGFKPIPIFTRGEDPSVLDDYYKTSDVVGIGGLVQTEGNKGYVKGIMRHVGERRVHWLGFTNIDFLKAFKPYMLDSSSWENGARYGFVKVYFGGGRFHRIIRADFKSRPDKHILDGISSLGVDPFSLSKQDAWFGSYTQIRTICARSAVRLSIDVYDRLGSMMFIATTGGPGLDLVCQSFEYFKSRSNQ